MLVSTKDQGLGRRRRSYSHSHVDSMNKLARSSKLSLLSAITTQSSGSNGSNSTVTQDSYNRSESKASKKRRTKRKKELPRSNKPPMEAVEEAISEGEEPHSEVDVFDFLVEDELRQSKENLVDPEPTPESSHELDASPQSLHSDSGISMDDGSLIVGQAMMKPLIPPSIDHPKPQRFDLPEIRFDWAWPEIPKPQHSHFHQSSAHHIGTAMHRTFHYLDMEQARLTHSVSTRELQLRDDIPFSHYEKLIAQTGHAPSSKTVLPLRSFTRSCRRQLLELQLTISELEDELKRLDVYCDQMRQQASVPTNAGSRRGSWQSATYPADLMPMKEDVSARLQMKLEQYCKYL